LNLDYRRERITKEIEGEKNKEPPTESCFKQVAANLWEKKDNQVGVFLREQHNGECQICGTTFKSYNFVPFAKEVKGDSALLLSLCDEAVMVQFTEKYLVDLQEIAKASLDGTI
jgi:hypothetical protein